MKKMLSVVLCLLCLFAFSAVGVAETDEFLSQVQGTFVALFPEMAKEEYHQAWVDDLTPFVGAENAEDMTA